MLTYIYQKFFRNKAAAWTAAFTCVLCIFSYLLYEVSDAANRLAITTEAASITGNGPGIIKQASPDGKALKGWAVAARTAELQSNIYVGTASPGKGLDFNQLPQDRIVTAVIGPKSAMQTTPGFVSLADAEEVQQGRKHMFFGGWAVYNDGISTSKRLSEYCFNVETVTFAKADHTDFSGDSQFVTNPCGVHFCFNEDCEDYKDRTK